MANPKSFALLILFIANILQSTAQTTLTQEQAVADLDFMVKTIEQTHYDPYKYISKEDWQKTALAYKQKYQSLQNIGIGEFSIDMQKLITTLNDPLSTVSYSRASLVQYTDSSQFFPSFLRLTSEGKIKIYEDYAPAGEELLEINGHKAKQLYEEAWATLSGTDTYKQHYLDYAFALFLFHKGIYAPFTFTFLPNGESKSISKTFPDTYPILLKELTRRVQRNTKPYGFDFIAPDIAYIAYDRCEDAQKFEDFLESNFRRIQEKNIKKLIIDIRYNMDMNTNLNSMNDLLLSYIADKPYRQLASRDWKVSQTMKEHINPSLYQNALGKDFVQKYLKAKNGSYLKEEFPLIRPKKPKYFFEGETCVLVGSMTSGAAAHLADAIETYELAKIIGNPTEQFANNFGVPVILEMPHSKLKFTCSTAYHIGANGNAEEEKVVLPYIEAVGDALGFALAWFDGR